MTKKAPSRTSYAILYWMAGALVLLIIGTLLLARTISRPPAPDPERTLVWVHDPAGPVAGAMALIIEESPRLRSLTLVGVPAPAEAQLAFARGPRLTRDQMATWLGRRLHHHVVLPLPVIATLVDAAGGITVASASPGAAAPRTLDGTAAVAHVRSGTATAAPAVDVMQGLMAAVTERGVRMTASEGFSLARQVDTDLDLLGLPNILTRWNQYPQKRPAVPAGAGADLLRGLLLPDEK